MGFTDLMKGTCWLFAPAVLAAPFTVAPTTNANLLTNALLGPGVTLVGSPVLTGISGQAGTFTGFTSGLYVNPITGQSGTVNMASGIILSSGNVSDAAATFVDFGASSAVNGSGDADLQAIVGIGRDVFDAASLTFQFQSTISQTLFFTFAFASTEYPVYVNSEFNDVFAFLLNGQNIALIPGTNNPIAINTVNAGEVPGNVNATNPAYFTQYSVNGTPFNYGGLTTLFTLQAPLQPGTNTIKFVIGDVSDDILDSAVLIQAGTFTSDVGIPEPSTYLMVGCGLGILALTARRRGH